MGRFAVELEIANYDDMVEARHGRIPPDRVRRLTISGLVDSGASRLVLPAAAVKALGLRPSGRVAVRYADGRSATRDQVQDVHITIQGRGGTFNATVEPKRQAALIGAIVLEDLDFVVDCTKKRLVPRDPNMIISEIE